MGYLKGRINRAVYWLLIVIIVVLYEIVAAFGMPPRISEVVLVIVAVPRLHDLGRSGWWMLLLIPWEIAQLATLFLPLTASGLGLTGSELALSGINLLGLAALIWMGAARGEVGANRFGEPPASGLGLRRGSGPKGPEA